MKHAAALVAAALVAGTVRADSLMVDKAIKALEADITKAGGKLPPAWEEREEDGKKIIEFPIRAPLATPDTKPDELKKMRPLDFITPRLLEFMAIQKGPAGEGKKGE